MSVARKITIEWDEGETGVFHRQDDGSWHQHIGGMAVTGYDPSNVMRVLSAAVGTKEIAE